MEVREALIGGFPTNVVNTPSTPIRRGAGVARAGRPGLPHACRLAASWLIKRGGLFPFPIE